ncbi:MAG: NAD(P)-binding domain-containing protein [Gammaproteobacteria bacterium]|jgi:thioredoxin reductase/NAD-dependent dihydropyrimidine dehydrogenase PreA subunit|nr:NAD(P)-binding domain-containing protein [Gammaproteobacteria bacterium]MDH3758088.1 NAD(P)-binding domain-containing protein [Gammaproteobacteria bacterium]MDH3846833.1 NAD(P)-binding domain-containing protein [Gammaproteobacteria bacterium]MDH3863781.1 NAD(P)-binding domain-containing protein [Gammaproteobacteria bacterium]MDH3954879.1 NAD(P)-binding domain-containing protein [Gammaproteobacteria bacterium]
MSPLLLALYLLPVIGIFVWYVNSRRRKESASIRAAEEAIAASMTEPPSLHPAIDPTKCIGCRSCVAACPEQYAHPVLGIIRGKARLVGPSNCIGHGACKSACPVDAIELVFGTEKRGVDIPVVKPDFETNIPGIFIAGELGGMGLIRNAVEQGRQALDSINKLKGLGNPKQLDLVIVGAGPAGIAASLGAMDAKLRSVTVEQDSLGGTVAHFPRGKLVMTRPAMLPIVGKMQFTETSKEKLLEYWQGVERQTGLNINYKERVTGIARRPDGQSFEVKTTKNAYVTRAVLLTIGRRGTPRQLGVPGEKSSKVVYRLIDPEQYRGQHVLVVGGGDSALEAAHSIAEQPGTTVTISYRSPAFTRAKPKNRDKVAQLATAGRMNVLMKSNVREIRKDSVAIDVDGKPVILPNQGVIVCAGGILPTGFLKEVGIEVETKYGTA